MNNNLLTTPTKPVEYIDKQVHLHIQQMNAVLGNFGKSAAGLAANQIGKNVRIFVYNDRNHTGPRAIINPYIVNGEGKHFDIEGCLSFPDTWAVVERFKNVTVRYVDFYTLNEKVEDFEGFDARLFQHEIEHLDGEIFINNLTEEDKNEFLARYARNNRSSKDPRR